MHIPDYQTKIIVLTVVYKTKAQQFLQKQSSSLYLSQTTNLLDSSRSQQPQHNHILAYPPLIPVMILVTSLSHCIFKIRGQSSIYNQSFEDLIDFLTPLLADTLSLTLKQLTLIFLRDVISRYMNFKQFALQDEEQNNIQNMTMVTVYKLLEKLKKASVNRKTKKLKRQNVFAVDFEDQVKVTIKYLNKDQTFRIIRNSGILNRVERKSKEALLEYPKKFQDCYNKLKVIILLAAASHVFESDHQFNKQFTELVSNVGFNEFKPLFTEKQLVMTLPQASVQPNQYKLGTAILLISQEIKKQVENYGKILSPYLQRGLQYAYTINIRKQIKAVLSSQIKEDCLQNQQMDIENTISSLQQFDELCGIKSSESDQSCSGVFKPAVQKWIQSKLNQIKQKISAVVKNQKWQPVNNKIHHSNSVVDLFWFMKSILDHAADKLGSQLFYGWKITFIAMIHESITDYCNEMIKSVGNIQKFKGITLKLPPLDVKIRKKMIQNKLKVENLPMMRAFPKCM